MKAPYAKAPYAKACQFRLRACYGKQVVGGTNQAGACTWMAKHLDVETKRHALPRQLSAGAVFPRASLPPMLMMMIPT